MAMGFEVVVPVHAVTIQPDDAIRYDPPLRHLWIGGGEKQGGKPGVLTVTLAAREEKSVQLYGVIPGTMLTIGAVTVHASTTCTNIVGFW